jgi:hypothetical protein
LKKLKLDKIGSVAKGANVRTDIYLGDTILSSAGSVVAGRVLNDKTVYNQMENCQGRLVRLKSGDIIAGVLGERHALHGYEGFVPDSIEVGDSLHLLNLGGVMGKCTSFNPDVGPPFEIEILGQVLHFPHLGKRIGEPAHVQLNAIPEYEEEMDPPPLIAVMGTCMNSGKTMAACEIIHGLTKAGKRVGAAKVTGVALQRDVLNMRDYGAAVALSFMDAGIVSTAEDTAAQVTRRLICHLCRSNPEVIVLEFGDGIMGEYGVQSILTDEHLPTFFDCVVLCANDPAGAWGAVRFLEQIDISTQIVSGPVTDNEVGRRFVVDTLGLKAANALTSPHKLHKHVSEELLLNAAV